MPVEAQKPNLPEHARTTEDVLNWINWYFSTHKLETRTTAGICTYIRSAVKDFYNYISNNPKENFDYTFAFQWHILKGPDQNPTVINAFTDALLKQVFPNGEFTSRGLYKNLIGKSGHSHLTSAISTLLLVAYLRAERDKNKDRGNDHAIRLGEFIEAFRPIEAFAYTILATQQIFGKQKMSITQALVDSIPQDNKERADWQALVGKEVPVWQIVCHLMLDQPNPSLNVAYANYPALYGRGVQGALWERGMTKEQIDKILRLYERIIFDITNHEKAMQERILVQIKAKIEDYDKIIKERGVSEGKRQELIDAYRRQLEQERDSILKKVHENVQRATEAFQRGDLYGAALALVGGDKNALKLAEVQNTSFQYLQSITIGNKTVETRWNEFQFKSISYTLPEYRLTATPPTLQTELPPATPTPPIPEPTPRTPETPVISPVAPPTQPVTPSVESPNLKNKTLSVPETPQNMSGAVNGPAGSQQTNTTPIVPPMINTIQPNIIPHPGGDGGGGRIPGPAPGEGQNQGGGPSGGTLQRISIKSLGAFYIPIANFGLGYSAYIGGVLYRITRIIYHTTSDGKPIPGQQTMEEYLRAIASITLADDKGRSITLYQGGVAGQLAFLDPSGRTSSFGLIYTNGNLYLTTATELARLSRNSSVGIGGIPGQPGFAFINIDGIQIPVSIGGTLGGIIPYASLLATLDRFLYGRHVSKEQTDDLKALGICVVEVPYRRILAAGEQPKKGEKVVTPSEAESKYLNQEQGERVAEGTMRMFAPITERKVLNPNDQMPPGALLVEPTEKEKGNLKLGQRVVEVPTGLLGEILKGNLKLVEFQLAGDSARFGIEHNIRYDIVIREGKIAVNVSVKGGLGATRILDSESIKELANILSSLSDPYIDGQQIFKTLGEALSYTSSLYRHDYDHRTCAISYRVPETIDAHDLRIKLMKKFREANIHGRVLYDENSRRLVISMNPADVQNAVTTLESILRDSGIDPSKFEVHLFPALMALADGKVKNLSFKLTPKDYAILHQLDRKRLLISPTSNTLFPREDSMEFVIIPDRLLSGAVRESLPLLLLDCGVDILMPQRKEGETEEAYLGRYLNTRLAYEEQVRKVRDALIKKIEKAGGFEAGARFSIQYEQKDGVVLLGRVTVIKGDKETVVFDRSINAIKLDESTLQKPKTSGEVQPTQSPTPLQSLATRKNKK